MKQFVEGTLLASNTLFRNNLEPSTQLTHKPVNNCTIISAGMPEVGLHGFRGIALTVLSGESPKWNDGFLSSPRVSDSFVCQPCSVHRSHDERQESRCASCIALTSHSPAVDTTRPSAVSPASFRLQRQSVVVRHRKTTTHQRIVHMVVRK